MNLSDAIPEDELTLARLAATKLAKIMHGLLSVGTASLAMESSAGFLNGKDRTPLGFLEVLGCIGVQPGHADMVPMLRDRVKELVDVTNQFFRLLTELANWRSMSSRDITGTVEQLGDCYGMFCERLGAFGLMLGMDADYTQQAMQDRAYLAAVAEQFAVGQSPLPAASRQ